MEWMEGFLQKHKQTKKTAVRQYLEMNFSLPQILCTEKGLSRNHTMAAKGDAQSGPLYFSRIGVRIAKSAQFLVL